MDHVSMTALGAALDTARAIRGLSWREVAREAGLSASTFTRIRQGNGIDLNGYAACCRWLSCPLDAFVVGPRTGNHPDLAVDLVTVLKRHGVPEVYWRTFADLARQLVPQP